MTVSEQLSIWAASASGDILVGITYDDKPYVVRRMKARDAIVGFERVTGTSVHRLKRDRLMQEAWAAAVARVADLNGVTCVIVEGRLPNGPRAATYRAVLSSAEPFL